jgi:oxalate decarboxylase family bicupin protein
LLVLKLKEASTDTSRYNKQNSDIFAPPGTDTGGIPNAQWPLGLSHNRLGLNGAGWARQQNAEVLPAAVELAGVDMRLSPGAYRELHWHQAGEWAYILKGSVRIQTVNENGQTFVDDLNEGDLWFFPPGVPHSLQALDQGCEFLLIFDNGFFSEDNTSLISELFLRMPRAVLAKNLKADLSALDNIPKEQLQVYIPFILTLVSNHRNRYIFPGTAAPEDIQKQNVTGPAGINNQPNTQFTYHWSKQPALEIPNAGSVKIVDPSTFPAAADISAALLTIKPGAIRELHWHPHSDEWNFFIKGKARMTIYQAPASSQTFDYGAGDVGYIPMVNNYPSLSQYIQYF